MKIRPVGSELFHADGRTDTMKLIVFFRNFANAPYNPVFVANTRCAFLQLGTEHYIWNLEGLDAVSSIVAH
jgi:hypothetical protein